MKTRSRPENEKPGNKNLNSRFTLKSHTTKPRLKEKISKSSKVQHCQNKTEKVQIPYKGMKEPSKGSPITAVEIQKSSKTPNENKCRVHCFDFLSCQVKLEQGFHDPK